MLRRGSYHSGADIARHKAITHSFTHGACRRFERAAVTFGVLAALTISQAFGVGTALAAGRGQSAGSGTIEGTVTDPNNAIVNDAAVTLVNRVTGYQKETRTDENGTFRFTNIPLNPYELRISAQGFSPYAQSVEVRTSVPLSLKIPLVVTGTTAEVTITSIGDQLEQTSTAHTDVDENLMKKLPVGSVGNGLSDIVSHSVPGVARDSNGFGHPNGDHAQATIVLDNQSISDQQSKAFSTQIPVNALQSVEVITGTPPAEYGDKTSLVINATTKSGLGLTRPTGSLTALYGSFGTTHEEATFGFGNQRLGNFVAFNFEHSGRFLDPPELSAIHDHGQSAGLFDRFDYNPTPKDSLHLNLFLSRNNFQIPDQYDQALLGQDQRQLVRSINVAPGYVHTFNDSTIMTINPYFRLDQIFYSPSANPFSDQTQTLSQQRRLNNVGIKADVAYNHGIHNAKAGLQASHTFLTENFQFGLTDPGFNSPCVNNLGAPIGDPTLTGPKSCNGTVSFANPNYLPGLAAFDLTRGGSQFAFHGHTDIKQEAFYAQDALRLHDLTLNLGLRFDNYNGIVSGNGWQPRAGIAYLIKPTGTVLRASYARTFETPYNENLILSSSTGAGGLAASGVLDQSTSANPLRPGNRNLFSAGLQQAIGKYIIVDAGYFWKYTHNAYDFNVILNSPIAFPIAWSKSKIDGVNVRVNLANYKGFSAFMIAGHTRARYFPPETGGLFFNSVLPAGAFRIDHDQAFQQTTQVQYQFNQIKGLAPYVAFIYNYDSGLVSGSVPDFATALTFSADQQAQIGLFCGGTFANPLQGITSCNDPNHGALRVRIPADGTVNDDHNPPRITPRHTFDASIGTENLFHTEHSHITLRFTAINLANKVALYNFNSTFSGTHFFPPRTLQAQLGIVF